MLSTLTLQNFRSYPKQTFTFDPVTTIIVGPNTAGKTNLMESIVLLATGKTRRAEKDTQTVRFDQELARVKGVADDTNLEVVLTNGSVAGVPAPLRRFLVNDIPKRRVDFASHIKVVSFSPSDLDMIIGSPSLRRDFLDDVLEQVDKQYRIACITYTKALRQRNALLSQAQETGIRNEKLFSYWDELLITNGQYISKKREEFLSFITASEHTVCPVKATYDHSLISVERLQQYERAEVSSGVTLVGPHRDDFFVEITSGGEFRNAKFYGSRGQQRLVVLQLKLLQLLYIEQQTGERPLLLLDDIFSELDSGHIQLVQDLLGKQQTIMTTTHKEFIDVRLVSSAAVIELKSYERI